MGETTIEWTAIVRALGPAWGMAHGALSGLAGTSLRHRDGYGLDIYDAAGATWIVPTGSLVGRVRRRRFETLTTAKALRAAREMVFRG